MSNRQIRCRTQKQCEIKDPQEQAKTILISTYGEIFVLDATIVRYLVRFPTGNAYFLLLFPDNPPILRVPSHKFSKTLSLPTRQLVNPRLLFLLSPQNLEQEILPTSLLNEIHKNSAETIFRQTKKMRERRLERRK